MLNKIIGIMVKITNRPSFITYFEISPLNSERKSNPHLFSGGDYFYVHLYGGCLKNGTLF